MLSRVESGEILPLLQELGIDLSLNPEVNFEDVIAMIMGEFGGQTPSEEADTQQPQTLNQEQSIPPEILRLIKAFMNSELSTEGHDEKTPQGQSRITAEGRYGTVEGLASAGVSAPAQVNEEEVKINADNANKGLSQTQETHTEGVYPDEEGVHVKTLIQEPAPQNEKVQPRDPTLPREHYRRDQEQVTDGRAPETVEELSVSAEREDRKNALKIAPEGNAPIKADESEPKVQEPKEIKHRITESTPEKETLKESLQGEKPQRELKPRGTEVTLGSEAEAKTSPAKRQREVEAVKTKGESSLEFKRDGAAFFSSVGDTSVAEEEAVQVHRREHTYQPPGKPEVKHINVRFEDAHLKFKFQSESLNVDIRINQDIQRHLSYLDVQRLSRNLESLGISLESLKVNGSELTGKGSRGGKRSERVNIKEEDGVDKKVLRSSSDSPNLNLLL
ncbi:hypothetical protein [Hydrogenivirga sp. 128-5-R1-1]|uniref:hypothetical protein n=1 Tax=Hydrogenivirga sp. 128-5-R1-1 TaxID=392423 RepID=UPI00015F37E5|nr:hypothetical protein [Hydrogenivirga sp. 128-5-R1-1]EDP76461.1 hypothetical protein HG1285_02603 [Hydrogenivirga sp. 128-5-R1-1]